MAFSASVSLVFIVFCLSYYPIAGKAQSSCEFIETTTDRCRSAQYITVEDQTIKREKGESQAMESTRIQLPGLQTEVTWYCGGTEERAAWGTKANQLRVFFRSDGVIQWNVYRCEDLSGPKKAGDNCAVPETNGFCPKFEGVNSSACVFEMKFSTSSVNSKTTTVSVEGTLRAQVEKKAGTLTATASAEIKGGLSHSVTQATIVTVESRQFIVIPPGYSFCGFTNNTSVPDVHSPTGFRWRCSFPQYVKAQERFNNGRCTSLRICDVGVCGRTVESGSDTLRIGLTLVVTACFIAFFSIF